MVQVPCRCGDSAWSWDIWEESGGWVQEYRGWYILHTPSGCDALLDRSEDPFDVWFPYKETLSLESMILLYD